MKLVPLGDRVVLKELKAEETTKSGIVLPGFSISLTIDLKLAEPPKTELISLEALSFS